MGETDRVLEDCNKALSLNPLYIKAVYRRAHALELKKDLEAALYGMCGFSEGGWDHELMSSRLHMCLHIGWVQK